jgi:hypothetical protein
VASDLSAAVERLAVFLADQPLTQVIAELEASLERADGSAVRLAAHEAGVDAQLLAAAIRVRQEFGRLSDVIHAAAILEILPKLFEEGEELTNRPSLAAGNDPKRPFDIETNLRVAEFKFAVWTGNDAMRKREVFKDLVRLAADASGRRPQLLVVGPVPERFLRLSRAKASWGLDRAPGMLQLFREVFGDPSVSVSAFRVGPGSRVDIINVARYLPPGILGLRDESG